MTPKQVEIARLRSEGRGIRSISRLVGAAPSTVVEVLQEGPARARRVISEAPLAEKFLKHMAEVGMQEMGFKKGTKG